jgi:hypothetical protein
MQRTDAWATAGIQHGIRFLGWVVALHIDKRQLDNPTLWVVTILGHDQIAAGGFVSAVCFVDTVSRLNARSVLRLRTGHEGYYESDQQK